MNRENPCPCGQPHDGWPGEGDSELCQDCWEAHCSESWWHYIATGIWLTKRPTPGAGGAA